jgi:hypothetical protein
MSACGAQVTPKRRLIRAVRPLQWDAVVLVYVDFAEVPTAGLKLCFSSTG